MNPMTRLSIRPSFWLIMVCIMTLWCIAGPALAKTVRLQLKWYHQAQFAGCYVAIEKGFYKEYGIQVELIEGGPGKSQTEALTEHRADFAISSPEDLLMHRSGGDSVTAVSAIYRKSAVVFLSRKNSGILKPADFEGKVIAAQHSGGVSDFVLQFDALVENMHVDRSNMVLVPYDTQYKGFMDGRVDITPAYFTGGLIKLRAWGMKINIIYPGDYRVRFYSDVVMTTDDLITSNPDLAQSFVAATLKGWRFAIENIGQSVDMILKYARIKDPSLQKKMLEAAVPLVHTGEKHIGWMTAEEWAHMYNILLDQKIITSPIDPFKDVFTNAFVEKTYAETLP